MKRRNLLRKAAAGATAAAASTMAFPVVARQRTELVMVSTWPRDFPGAGTGAQHLAERIGQMSDGRIQVRYFAAGERVNAFDAFDEVASGNADLYHAAEGYWTGKHPGFAYFSAVPFGLTASEMNAWVEYGGGQELWDELAGDFALKCLPAGNTGAQMGGWFRKEIGSADDFKGLKIRMPGLGGDVMAKLGAAAVSLPGSQVYKSLLSGVIDAAEWAGPWNDRAMKLYEAARFYYYPGIHEPGTMYGLGINAKLWASLSRTDRALISAAAAESNDKIHSEYYAKNGAALVKLQREDGVQLRKFGDDVIDSFGDAAIAVFAEVREHSSLSRRIHDSFVRARASVGAWSGVAELEYIRQRRRVLGL